MHLKPYESAANRFTGRVETIVYIGTDTHYGIRLKGGQAVRVREQNNAPGSKPLANEGDEVLVSFDTQAARVLTE
jgi:spermidine/putrescine transport system ATP-binding protein